MAMFMGRKPVSNHTFVAALLAQYASNKVPVLDTELDGGLSGAASKSS